MCVIIFYAHVCFRCHICGCVLCYSVVWFSFSPFQTIICQGPFLTRWENYIFLIHCICQVRFDDFCDLSCVLLFFILMFVSNAIFAVVCSVIYGMVFFLRCSQSAVRTHPCFEFKFSSHIGFASCVSMISVICHVCYYF